MRNFNTGATRDTDEGKLDYDGFFSPLVLKRRAEYMHSHRIQADGTLRDSDNWQQGIPLKEYIKSGWRHFWEWWAGHRGTNVPTTCQDIEEAICALMFNAEGYLHELLKNKPSVEILGCEHKAYGIYCLKPKGHGDAHQTHNHVWTTGDVKPWTIITAGKSALGDLEDYYLPKVEPKHLAEFERPTCQLSGWDGMPLCGQGSSCAQAGECRWAKSIV